jgi:spermidine synthase
MRAGLPVVACGLRAFAAILAAVLPPAPSSAQQARNLLESKESLYNNIYVYQNDHYVSLTFGHNKRLYTESVYNTLDDRDLPIPYTRFMTVGLAYAQGVDHILEIGFGGGRTAWYLHRFLPQATVGSVELDPAVLALAQKYFGIRDEPNFSVATSDGRLFLKKSDVRYDMIMVDAYRGPFVPFHLLTKEFYALAKSRLAPGGVLVQNVEPTTMLFDSAALTISAVFAHVDVYPAEGNVVMVAYDGEPLTLEALAQKAGERQKAFGFRYDLAGLLSQRQTLDASEEKAIDKDAKILTDDFAPVETLKAIERRNRKWSDR